MTTITGQLTDYALMTEGVHTGRYAARIDDKPYPVQSHVDPFLLRLQKGQTVDVSLKNVDDEEWISKIVRSKIQQQKPERPGEVDIAGDAIEQAQARVNTAKVKEAAEMKAKLEHDEMLLAKARAEEQAAISRDKAVDEKLKKHGFDQPPMKSTMDYDMDRINRESEEHGKKLQAEIAARKAAQNPAPITQLVPIHQDIIPATTFNNDQIKLIKATVARGCTDTEFELLMYLSAQYGLDPIRRQIWAVKYGNSPASIFTGRDGFLEIAHRSGTFDGMESGVKTVREGEKNELVGWCKVYRKDMSHAFYVEVYEQEYTTGKSLWLTKPRIMIQKVAESSCLRRAFSVSGLYCPEEMPDNAGAL